MKKNLVLSGPSNLFSQKLGFGNPDLSCTIIEFKKTSFFYINRTSMRSKSNWVMCNCVLIKKNNHTLMMMII